MHKYYQILIHYMWKNINTTVLNVILLKGHALIRSAYLRLRVVMATAMHLMQIFLYLNQKSLMSLYLHILSLAPQISAVIAFFIKMKNGKPHPCFDYHYNITLKYTDMGRDSIIQNEYVFHSMHFKLTFHVR